MRDRLYQSSREVAERDLLARLHDLDTYSLALLVMRLLTQIGYTAVRLHGRRHKRGRKARGGFDVSARLLGELSMPLTLVQIKQYTVQRRFVDELRGVLLRTGASHGIIVSTAPASTAALVVAERYQGRSVRIIAGAELARLMASGRIGVRVDTDHAGHRQWQVDEELFDRLEKAAIRSSPGRSATRPRASATPSLEAHKSASSWHVRPLLAALIAVLLLWLFVMRVPVAY